MRPAPTIGNATESEQWHPRRVQEGRKAFHGAIALGAICGFGGIVYVGFQTIDGTIAWRDSIPIVASIIAIGFIICALVTALMATSD